MIPVWNRTLILPLSAISAVKYDSAAACQFFSFDLWKMLFCEQKSNVFGGHAFCEFLVLEFWLCRLWNKWAPRWFSQEYEQWKTPNPDVANHTEYPLEAEFATWTVICLTFPLWWVTFVNCFCLQMECKNWDHSFKSDCQTNYNPGKQLGNILYACKPSSFQKKYFVQSTILIFAEKLEDAIWNLLWRSCWWATGWWTR